MNDNITQDALDQALGILRASADEQEAALVVMPPDAYEFIRGNRAGFTQLAIAAILAAQGMDQAFKDEHWVSDWDMDWGSKA